MDNAPSPNRKIIEDMLEVLNMPFWWNDAETTFYERFCRHMDDNIDWWVSGMPSGSKVSKDDFQQSGELMRQVADGPFRIFATGWTEDGDRIAVEAESDMPLKSGGTYNNHYHFLFEFSGGKIVAFHEHNDTAHLKKSFGME